MTKTEWDALRYPVQLQELSEEEGGGWIAWIPLLGKGMFMMDADTPAEAIEQLEEHRKSCYDVVINSGVPIPMPDEDDEPVASGKWLQRTSRRLHAELKAAAAKDGVSFNTFCENALTRCLQQWHGENAMGVVAGELSKLIRSVKKSASYEIVKGKGASKAAEGKKRYGRKIRSSQ
ncbi:MAG: toxin-antitoxin system HicB family antitoxin [Fimbriimonadales bacterium]